MEKTPRNGLFCEECFRLSQPGGGSKQASAGRWGGEEFMLMVPGATQEAAAAFAEELRQGIEKLRFEKCGKISASFGVAQALPGEDPDPLVVRADTALYKAKASGKNTVCCAHP